MIKTLLHLAALFSALSISAFGGGKVVLPSMHNMGTLHRPEATERRNSATRHK